MYTWPTLREGMVRSARLFSITLSVFLLLIPFKTADGQAGADRKLVGVWNCVGIGPRGGRVASQIVLQSNGSYSKQYKSLVTGYMTTTFGTYQVGPGQLRLNIRRGEPTQTCGPLGCNPIRYPAGESYSFAMPDANTLQLHFNLCASNQCNCTYKRAA